MWFFIDSSERGRLRLAQIPVFGAVHTHDVVAPRYALIREISAFMPKDRLAELKGVCVVRGPGSFSAVRGGVLVANIMARILRIPLFSLDRSEAADLEVVRDGLVQGLYHPKSYVAPTYDTEPNITIPSSSLTS
jgi:hypothetical protein